MEKRLPTGRQSFVQLIVFNDGNMNLSYGQNELLAIDCSQTLD